LVKKQMFCEDDRKKSKCESCDRGKIMRGSFASLEDDGEKQATAVRETYDERFG